MSAVQYILGLGPSVMLPLVLLVVGLIFGLSFGKAFRGGLYVGVAFVGINLALGLLMGNLQLLVVV
ncbi:MAG: PTS transporter subunit IIC [Bacillota bacterium]